MNQNKNHCFIICCVMILMGVLNVTQLKSYWVNIQNKVDEIYVIHSIFDDITFNSYVFLIVTFYSSQLKYVEEVILFEFEKPKGFNNQQLTIKYAVLLEGDMLYGILYVEITSVFSFVYIKHGKMIIAMAFIVILFVVHTIKMKIKKRWLCVWKSL